MQNQKKQWRGTKGNRYYIRKLNQFNDIHLDNTNEIDDWMEYLDDLDLIDQYNTSKDTREYQSNVYDIKNGDNFEDYAKEFYEYYKECFEDLYEDY